MFDKGEDVGQNLTGVKFVGQAIDDRDTRVGGKALQTGLLESTNHDDIDHAGNHAGGIFNGFGAAQLRVGGGQVNDRTAQLIHTGFKRNPGTGTGFFKNHRQGAVVQCVVRLIAFELVFDQACAVQHI